LYREVDGQIPSFSALEPQEFPTARRQGEGLTPDGGNRVLRAEQFGGFELIFGLYSGV